MMQLFTFWEFARGKTFAFNNGSYFFLASLFSYLRLCWFFHFLILINRFIKFYQFFIDIF